MCSRSGGQCLSLLKLNLRQAWIAKAGETQPEVVYNIYLYIIWEEGSLPGPLHAHSKQTINTVGAPITNRRCQAS